MYADMYDVILNTDPLALTALGGLVTEFVVTIGLFILIMTRSDPKKNTGAQ
jgi:glycerol uptake facilitator-like aquaporin